MTRQHVSHPGGRRAIVYGPSLRCRCGRVATLLCDWKVSAQTSGTCDIAICERCTMEPVLSKNLCPMHAKMWADRVAVALSKPK